MDEDILKQIAELIAEAEETEPQRLDIVLQNHVSTDAIRELVDHDSNAWRLQFETPNHVVEVLGDNTVIIDGRERRALA